MGENQNNGPAKSPRQSHLLTSNGQGEKPLTWQSVVENLEEEFQLKFEKTDLPVVFRWSNLNSEGFSHPDAAKAIEKCILALNCARK